MDEWNEINAYPLNPATTVQHLPWQRCWVPGFTGQDFLYFLFLFFSGFLGGPLFPFCQRSRLHFGVGWEWMG